jgi:hypothetical protein
VVEELSVHSRLEVQLELNEKAKEVESHVIRNEVEVAV